MKFPFFAIGMIAVFGWIIIDNYPPLIYYWSALMLLVSFLHTRDGYKPYRNVSNLFFLVYIYFITWVRTRPYKFSAETAFWINNAEHMIFALVVCLVVSLYLTVVFSVRASFGRMLLYTVIAFNLIGVFNEYFQNMINHRALAILTPDSKKDLLMNVAGTFIFAVLASLYHFNKQRFATRNNS